MIRSIPNIRDLGGYDSPYGTIRPHRFMRCGSTSSVSSIDLLKLRHGGVRRVLDLRSDMESPRATCRFSRLSWIEWGNVPFYDVDISAPTMIPAHDTNNYLVTSYLHMLAGAEAVRRVFSFCAAATPRECVLFHCAAGMDRTGMVSMLLLGLIEVPREQIIIDYCLSFGTHEEVQDVLHGKLPEDAYGSYLLRTRHEAIAETYDTLIATHGSVREFLESCDVPEADLQAVRNHLVA